MKPSFLVISDLLDVTQRAAAWAARLAAPAGAQLVLLHVETMPVIDPTSGMMVTPVMYLSPTQEINDALTELAQQLPVETTVEVWGGVLSAVLPEMIARYQPELLVLGLNEEHDVLDRLLLNQALPSLRDTRLPLLLVPAATSNPTLPHRVALAVDGEPFHLSKQAEALKPILSAWAAEYSVIHVARASSAPEKEMRQALASVQMSGLLPAVPNECAHEVRHASPATGVLRAVAEMQADLLVLIARPRSFLSALFHHSVTAEVARRSSVPMLVLPVLEEHSPIAKTQPNPSVDLKAY
ncbi:universal stress protein [Hymenobacter jejuensis]|uniref:Universal stress protein n=1 Tax=Hymenobacter jejuensis TaxID=2502781 RepID=A0A5B8A2Y8_9BACT|nr:universal stress protein [Hymenobacter jejuensis]QDA61025.1 universal stress protein [Hymenobacter jejuensis]